MDDGTRCALENGLYCGVDWLSFTFPVSVRLADALTFFGFSFFDFMAYDTGAFGYRKRMKHCQFNVSVLFDGNVNMGVHFDVSGSAVPALVQAYASARTAPDVFGAGFDYIDFDMSLFQHMLVELRNSDVNFSRIDLNVDDVGAKFYTMEKLHKIGKKLAYVSRFKQWHEEKSSDTSDGSTTGFTIYCGERKSDIMLRIYDKRLEQNVLLSRAGLPPSSDLWIRWELELKRKECNAAVDLLITNARLPDVVVGILSGYIRLIDLDASRRCRCSTSTLWESFLSGIPRARLARAKPDLDLDAKRDWLLRQCSRSLATVTAADGGDLAFVEKMLLRGQLRQTIHDDELVQRSLETRDF